MKSTGIVRSIDQLGRIVIPSELRKVMDISPDDKLEIFVDGQKIILRKFEYSCIFCNESEDLVSYKSKMVCPSCLKKLREVQ